MENKKKKPDRKNKNSIQLYADDETYIALHKYLDEVPPHDRGGIKDTVIAGIRMFLAQKGYWPPQKNAKAKKEDK